MARPRRREGPTTAVENGRVRGLWADGSAVAVFRGIPYAKPPVGERRWRSPEPADDWSGVRSARKEGPTALQRGTMIDSFFGALIDGQGWNRARTAAVKKMVIAAPRPKAAEDCLTLTVRTPDPGPGARLPVMVWIHGGDHQDGAKSDIYYLSNSLAGHGVVTVAINYRLGLMGYLAHPELSAESDHGVSGNYGTLDQIAALRWVRDNISSFGGDPDNVTIFGESAGGESVMHLMTSPLAHGLFHKAIAESPANSCQMLHRKQPFCDYDSAERNGEAFARALGLTGPGQAERLRSLPARDLMSLARSAPRLGDHFPAIDGYVIPESPLAAFAAGRQVGVPFVVGSNTDEGTCIRPVLGAPMVEYRHRRIPESGLQVEMAEAFGDDIGRLLELYPGLERHDMDAEVAFCGDYMFGARAYWYAHHHSKAGHPTWLYMFARTPPSPRQTAGASHAAEVPFVHGRSVPVLPLTAADKALSAVIQRYWTDHARSGSPNGGGTAEWPSFDPDDPYWLRLDHHIKAVPVDRLERYEILNRRTARLVDAMHDIAST